MFASLRGTPPWLRPTARTLQCGATVEFKPDKVISGGNRGLAVSSRITYADNDSFPVKKQVVLKVALKCCIY